MRNPRLSTAVFMLLATATGCIDLDPFPPLDAGVTADAADAAGPADDAETDGDQDPIAKCTACLEAPAPEGCQTENNDCNAEPKCGATMVCAVAKGCLALPTLAEMNQCGFPCAIAAGITSPTEQAVLLLGPITTCADANCKVACGGMPK